MQRLILLALLALGALILNTLFPDQPAEIRQTTVSVETFYPVTKVIDGDTVEVVIGEQTEKLRLIGIDTPEVDARLNPVECYGKEASEATKELLLGKEVRLEQDDTQDIRDRYNRLLVYVFLPDGTNINEKLIKDGFAREYTYNKPYRYQADFRAAEAAAREAEIGLWSSLCAR
jgi:micrococcal nuclease